jgi:hypothetical protein
LRGQQFQQLRLAGAVRTEQYPALAGANPPVNATQHRLAAQGQTHILQIDADKAGGGGRAGQAKPRHPREVL